MRLTKNRTISRALLTAGISAIAMTSVPALAQDADAEEQESDGNIYVTAQFREQRVQDTPLAITAISSEMLEAKNQTNLSQVADRRDVRPARPGTCRNPARAAGNAGRS
jgi:iron complex outermembrane receptor protein